MKCFDCGFNNPSTATVCKGCNGPLDRKVIALIRKPDTAQEQLTLSVWTAEYEAKRYGLEPKRYDEAEQAFIDRINTQKTPWVCAEHTRILARLDEQRKEQVRKNMKLLVRDSTGDDEQPEVAA